jgi:hypothetical protein
VLEAHTLLPMLNWTFENGSFKERALRENFRDLSYTIPSSRKTEREEKKCDIVLSKFVAALLLATMNCYHWYN